MAMLLSSWGTLRADLVWDQKELTQTAQVADKVAVCVFKFKNAGVEPVTILTTHSSCGCIVAHLHKKTYAPGEVGEIKITFQFGSRTGEQRQSVQVRTSSTASDAELKLSVIIPKWSTLTPALLFWRQGEELAPKVLTLKFETPGGIRIISVTSSDPRFKVAARAITDGKEYHIDVVPLVTEQKKSGSIAAKTIITIQTDLPAPSKSTLHAYAFIKR